MTRTGTYQALEGPFKVAQVAKAGIETDLSDALLMIFQEQLPRLFDTYCSQKTFEGQPQIPFEEEREVRDADIRLASKLRESNLFVKMRAEKAQCSLHAGYEFFETPEILRHQLSYEGC